MVALLCSPSWSAGMRKTFFPVPPSCGNSWPRIVTWRRPVHKQRTTGTSFHVQIMFKTLSMSRCKSAFIFVQLTISWVQTFGNWAVGEPLTLFSKLVFGSSHSCMYVLSNNRKRIQTALARLFPSIGQTDEQIHTFRFCVHTPLCMLTDFETEVCS